MLRLTDKLRDGRILISDGAWGTFLHEQGLQPGECPELWCLTHPEAVRNIAAAYIKAGADMVETNSFGANRFKLEHFNLSEKVRDINEAAARLSREAAGTDHFVIASVGPTGKLLITEEVPEEDIYNAFKEQALGLEAGGADAVCIETFSALDEATLALRAARENTRLQTLVTFTFERTVQGDYRTMMGVSPAQMARAMAEAGADIIGSNCGNGMEGMVAIVTEMRAAAPSLPVLVHANAGLPVLKEGHQHFPESPDTMAQHSVHVVRAGAQIIGGCCGTTPMHIAALRKQHPKESSR